MCRERQVVAAAEDVIQPRIRIVAKYRIGHLRRVVVQQVIDTKTCRKVVAKLIGKSEVEIVLVTDRRNRRDKIIWIA